MVANLYVLQNTEGNKNFLWHKQLNYDITASEQHVNPAEIGTNQSRIPCLSICWKELVLLRVPTSFKTESKNSISIFHTTRSTDICTDTF